MALKGCLVGCGYFAQFQVEAWKRMSPQVELAGLCDVDPAKAARFGTGNVYTDLETMLDREKPDFLDIVTRPEHHQSMARMAADRGIHILCQKPFAETIGEAREIIESCRNVRLMVNENFRWQAWYRETKRLLQDGAIGEPFTFHWQHRANDGLLDPPYPEQPYFIHYPRFLIYEVLVHHLDTSRFLFGEPRELSCMTARVNPKMAGEDLAFITLRYHDGFAGIIDANRCAPTDNNGRAMGNFRIDGHDGTLWMTDEGCITLEPRNGSRKIHHWHIPVQGYRGDACYGTQKHFAESLISGQEFETSGDDYLRTMTLVDLAYTSAREGKTLPVLYGSAS